MNRTDLINHYTAKFEYCKYLEIGIDSGVNYANIKAGYKLGIDIKPAPGAVVVDSGKILPMLKGFDVIFIDGDHRYEPALRDLVNAYNALNVGGYLIAHDCTPTSESRATDTFTKNGWYGRVYAAWHTFINKALEPFLTHNDDCGIGVLKKTKSKKLEISNVKPISYKDFDSDRSVIKLTADYDL